MGAVVGLIFGVAVVALGWVAAGHVARAEVAEAAGVFDSPSHGLCTGDGPICVTGARAGYRFWVVRVDADRFAIAASRRAAMRRGR